jgi:hypothetical protein
MEIIRIVFQWHQKAEPLYTLDGFPGGLLPGRHASLPFNGPGRAG